MAPQPVEITKRVYTRSIALTGYEIQRGQALAQSRNISFSAMMRHLLDRELLDNAERENCR